MRNCDDRWSSCWIGLTSIARRSVNCKSGAPPWLDAEWLPAYAPDLNPVEALWSCTKHGHLANYNPDDLFDLGDAVVDSFCRQRRDRRIKESYFQTAKLQI